MEVEKRSLTIENASLSLETLKNEKITLTERLEFLQVNLNS